jgi:hypothetical protein
MAVRAVMVNVAANVSGMRMWGTLIDTVLRPVLRAYKDPAFEDEREWRLGSLGEPFSVQSVWGAASIAEGSKISTSRRLS